MGVFSPSGVSNVSTSNTDLLVTTPAISNTTLGLAGAETGIALPAGTKRFSLRARGIAKLQLAYTSGQSGSVYREILPGNIYEEGFIDTTVSLTVYVQSNKASTIVELVSWS